MITIWVDPIPKDFKIGNISTVNSTCKVRGPSPRQPHYHADDRLSYEYGYKKNDKHGLIKWYDHMALQSETYWKKTL